MVLHFLLIAEFTSLDDGLQIDFGMKKARTGFEPERALSAGRSDASAV